MTENGNDLEVNIGVSLQRLARQMARIDGEFRKAAIKQEKEFARANQKIARQFDRLAKSANSSLSTISFPGGLAEGLPVRSLSTKSPDMPMHGRLPATRSQRPQRFLVSRPDRCRNSTTLLPKRDPVSKKRRTFTPIATGNRGRGEI